MISALKVILLIFESRTKRTYLRDPYKDLPVEQTVSDLNRAFLVWVTDLIKFGNSTLLTNDDLPELDEKLSSRGVRLRMEDIWAQTARPEVSEGGKVLLWALLKSFRGSLFLNAIPRFMIIAFKFAQPVLVNSTIQYVTQASKEAGEDDATGYYLILTTSVIYIGSAVSICIYDQLHNRIRVQIRGSIIGLVHARCLTMRDGIYDDAAAVTHMSSDADNIELLPWQVQELWAQMMEVLIGMLMLWNELGWWSLTPLVIVAVFSRIAKWIGGRISKSMVEWQQAKQERIALTNSVIDSVKNIKVMGMTDMIMVRVQGSRVFDIAKGIVFRRVVVHMNMAGKIHCMAVGILVPVVTIIFYAVDAHVRGTGSLDTTKAFTAVAIITLVTLPANQLLVQFPQLMSIYGCATRVQNYLLEPARDDTRVLIKSPSSSSIVHGNGYSDQNGQIDKTDTDDSLAVIVDSLVLRPAAKADICLENLSVKLKAGSFNIICGAVGSGKTTFARAILGDVAPDSGSIAVSTKRIGYCAQKPWLTNASIKAMVCGPSSEECDEQWYRTVIHACGLDEDIEQLTGGDLESMGSRGTMLSGGQRQRVALARAVYSRPEIVILDDVLSALDAKTEAHVAENLLGPKGIFKQRGTTVILITHATQHLPLADLIVVLADSKIEEQGTWADLQTSTGHISKLQVKVADQQSARNTGNENPSTMPGTSSPPITDKLDLSRQTGDLSVYSYYFNTIGAPLMIIFLFCCSAYGATFAITPLILRAWTEGGDASMWFYTGIYGLNAALAFASTVCVIWVTLILIGPKAGLELHHRQLKIIMRAPLSYFAITDTGTIVNRFSADLQYIDMALPFNMLLTAFQVFRLLAQLILLFITQALIAIGAPFLFLVLYIIQRVYLRSSRQIRFLDIEMRAEVLSNFLETLEGMSHIRALGWELRAIDQNIKALDISQRPNYIMHTIQQWLGVILQLLVAGLAVLVVGLAVAFRSSTTGGQMGIALNVILGFSSTLVRLLEGWTHLETTLGAVARIKSLEESLIPEDLQGENLEASPEWPEKGAMEFENVIASYNPETIALKGISAKISPGQKVGICGRTGSGKSTLLLSILRLVELDSGKITIDGVDIATLPRQKVRESLIAIPQDTFILNDSIRLNIDPSGTVSDLEIIEALEKVQLWKIIKSRGKSGRASNTDTATPSGIATPANEAAANDVVDKSKDADPLDFPLKDSPLSHGQFQVFGLARALLLKDRSRILILDEATSNVDAKTDELIQLIIREEFSKHTILTIAHRLDTIRDADMILVMDKGKIVESGSPKELLAVKVEDEGPGGSGVEEGVSSDKAWFKEMWDNVH
ncbi:putative multidrug resistance protein [Calycina marina]|uniref:Multidrug resistance protein n=1 Tax=Calycina marina TaxID=1763456 RepID=A0A9P7Z8R9_9HELO|nr:putative multidrug resistance protein [Calycina marina]